MEEIINSLEVQKNHTFNDEEYKYIIAYHSKISMNMPLLSRSLQFMICPYYAALRRSSHRKFQK